MHRIIIIGIAGLVLVGGGAALVMLTGRPAETPPATVAVPRVEGPAPAASPAAGERPRAEPARTAPTRPEPTPAAPPTTGTLIIESDVPETSVFVDRVYLGNAPVTAANLAPGPHRLNMSPTGYEGIAETIDVEAGTRTISIKFKEIRLDEKILVVHKHTFGSCSGTLRASPGGLTYDTMNAGDAFTAALTELESFEMDYVQKNLKVKLRGGKTYTFTDADDNADHLYLFHQAVEKVRQRLLAGRRP